MPCLQLISCFIVQCVVTVKCKCVEKLCTYSFATVYEVEMHI